MALHDIVPIVQPAGCQDIAMPEVRQFGDQRSRSGRAHHPGQRIDILLARRRIDPFAKGHDATRQGGQLPFRTGDSRRQLGEQTGDIRRVRRPRPIGQCRHVAGQVAGDLSRIAGQRLQPLGLNAQVALPFAMPPPRLFMRAQQRTQRLDVHRRQANAAIGPARDLLAQRAAGVAQGIECQRMAVRRPLQPVRRQEQHGLMLGIPVTLRIDTRSMRPLPLATPAHPALPAR